MKHFYDPFKPVLKLLPAFLVLITFASCEKFEGGQTVPAYIQIDSIGLQTDYDLQGSASHNITDAWVYVDDRLLGAYELPAKIPVLQEGLHRLEIRPGIKMNGIAATRVIYPFYKPIVKENYMFIPGSIGEINETTTYYDNVKFLWMEDFESQLSIEETTKSDTVLIRTQEEGEVFEGAYSGKINLNTEDDLYEGASELAYLLPRKNEPIFVEVDFKINNVLTFGLFSQGFSEIYQEGLVNLNTTDTWKKIYINYTPAVNRNSTAIDFKIFLGSVLQTDLSNAELLIDNIKLVHRDI